MNLKNKKILFPIIIISIIVIIVISVVVTSNSKPSINPEVVIKNFSKALESKDINKMSSFIDFKGATAWGELGFDEENFSNSDYEDFIEEYDKVTVSNSIEVKNNIKEYYENLFNEGDSVSVWNITKANKIGKDLYSVEAYFSIGGQGWGGQGNQNFIVYKGKIVAPLYFN